MRLASAGYDGTIRIWDPDTGSAQGQPLTGHAGGVLSLAAWRTAAGANRLVSVGYDGTVRIWEPDRSAPVGAPMAGHVGRVWAVTAWIEPDGAARVASGADDGTVLVWDPDTSHPVGAPLTGHSTGVRALTSWRDADGTRIAAACGDGTILVWDPATGRLAGPPLVGHTLWSWALTSWAGADGRHRLASASYDGTIRLWDPQLGYAIRTIEVGALTLWGLTDAPASLDVLGRSVFAEALAHQMYRPDEASTAAPGPTVVTIEGPWGCGKSTLMRLIQAELSALDRRPRTSGRARNLTVREAVGLLKADSPDRPEQSGLRRGVVTVWFNPWTHQSSSEVWAGLTHAIIEAAAPVLYPTVAQRERYWFVRNVHKVDRYAVLRSLRRRVLSPLFGVGLAVVVAQLGISLTGLDRPFVIAGRQVTPALIAIVLSAAFVLVGAVHTAARYCWGRVRMYLPGDFLTGPLAGNPAGAGSDEADRADVLGDPLRRATGGPLYLHQHDVNTLLADLGKLGYELIVFVDDLDRCRADTTADVFQAINLFLSGLAAEDELRGRFVIGLDPVVVAAHLDRVHAVLNTAGIGQHGDDPSLGWAYLRKLVQLPVFVPEVTDDGMARFVETVTGAGSGSDAPSAAGASVNPVVPGPGAASGSGPSHAGGHQGGSEPERAQSPAGPRGLPRRRQTAVETVPWRSLERHPQVNELIRQRLAAQPGRSIREAKRLLNVWQLYERILSAVDPVRDPAAAIARARRLVLVAEIVTRWPALQRFLHQRLDGRRGLELLAAAAHDDEQWASTVRRLRTAGEEHQRALHNLRQLLRDHEGVEVAALAGRVT
jgi:hypothetical protein